MRRFGSGAGQRPRVRTGGMAEVRMTVQQTDGGSRRSCCFAVACWVLLAAAVLVIGVVSLKPGRSADPTSPFRGERLSNLTHFAGVRNDLSSHDGTLVVANIGGNVVLYFPLGLLVALLAVRRFGSLWQGAAISLVCGSAFAITGAATFAGPASRRQRCEVRA